MEKFYIIRKTNINPCCYFFCLLDSLHLLVLCIFCRCCSWKQHKQYLFPDSRDGGRAAEEDGLGTTSERLGKIICILLTFVNPFNSFLQHFHHSCLRLEVQDQQDLFNLLEICSFPLSWSSFGCLGIIFLFVP